MRTHQATIGALRDEEHTLSGRSLLSEGNAVSRYTQRAVSFTHRKQACQSYIRQHCSADVWHRSAAGRSALFSV